MPIIKSRFLKNCGLESVKLVKLPQDASTKTFDRVMVPGADSLMLMHYPESYDNFDKFIIASKAIIQAGLLAPKVLACDKKNFLVLLEDFGDLSVNKYMQNDFVDRSLVYKKIINTLCQMQTITPSLMGEHSAAYCNQTLLNELKVTTNWYFPYLGLNKEGALVEQFFTMWHKILNTLPFLGNVFVHRDFHVDNLYMVNNQIGIIDSQDCLFGSPLYDLVSLLDDARVDVDKELKDFILNYYLGITGFNRQELSLAYNILGAQRNSRILGVFARKAMQGNNNYTHLIPRVIDYLHDNLLAPELKEVADFYYENNILTFISMAISA